MSDELLGQPPGSAGCCFPPGPQSSKREGKTCGKVPHSAELPQIHNLFVGRSSHWREALHPTVLSQTSPQPSGDYKPANWMAATSWRCESPAMTRMPRLLLREKALRLAQRHVRRCKTSRVHCFFLGSVAVDADEEGVTVTLDRFDPGREQASDSGHVPAAPLPGDVLVPCLFSSQKSSDDVIQSEAELKRSISTLQAHVSGRQPLELCQLMKVKGRVSCQQRGDAAAFWLSWSSVCPSVRLDVHPVRPVPVIPTTLLRSLRSSGGRRRGFVTMDQSRKLLLLLESDPKASKLPLVGVWLSGVSQVWNPHVCAWCLRFLFGSALQDRVLSEDAAFLLVVLASPHAAPAFFQCRRWPPAQMDCQLLSASRAVTLYQGAPAEGPTLEFELIPEGHLRQAFQDAQSSFSGGGPQRAAACSSERDSGVEDDDSSPRPSPRPYYLAAQQAARVQPAVPKLSLLMGSAVADSARHPDDMERTPPLLHSTPDPNSPHRPTCRPPLCTPVVPCDPPLSTQASGHVSPGASTGSPPRMAQPAHATESCDAHRLLFQQERELRLLQAQVQLLLEAQGAQPTHKPKTTSSVAVATGASLLWGSQTPPTQDVPRPLNSSSRESDVAGREPPVEVEPRFFGDHTCGRIHTQEADEATRSPPAAADEPSQEKGHRAGGGGQEVVSMMSPQRSVTPSSASASAQVDPDGTAISLGYLKRSPLGPALSPLSPSNMSVATATYMRRHGLLAAPPELLPQSQLIRELRPKMALLADSNKEKAATAGQPPSLARAAGDASVGNILDLSRLRQLPKLF